MFIQIYKIWINISLGNGLLPDSTEPSLETMLNIQLLTNELHPQHVFEYQTFKITATPQRAQWVNWTCIMKILLLFHHVDAILGVQEIPLWRYKDYTTVLSPEWEFV